MLGDELIAEVNRLRRDPEWMRQAEEEFFQMRDLEEPVAGGGRTGGFLATALGLTAVVVAMSFV